MEEYDSRKCQRGYVVGCKRISRNLSEVHPGADCTRCRKKKLSGMGVQSGSHRYWQAHL